MLIPETGTKTQFPDDAVLSRRQSDNALLRVTDTKGGVLWSLRDGKGHFAPIEASKPKPMRNIIGRELPPVIEQALVMVLGSAHFQSVRAPNPAMQEYFHGVVSGMHTAIGILCGGLGYNINFLEVHSDNGESGTDSIPAT